MDLIQKILISDVMENLRRRERKILDLYYNFGYKEREIAKHYNISQQRVNKIRNRALEKCKVKIESDR